MKKIAVYPGSFNPWHAGHRDILLKAARTFDKVIVAIGKNPEKDGPPITPAQHEAIKTALSYNPVGCDTIEVKLFSGLLRDFVEEVGACAVIRGLRNGQDFEYERSQQYWNEDLGMKVPVFYVIADRALVHVSSSAIRMVQKLKG